MLETKSDLNEAPLERLLVALPPSVRRGYEWVCQPKFIWFRIPLALLLIVGGFLGFLPILGFWMVPIGVLLIAEDVPFLHRPTIKALGGIQSWWDRRRRSR
jgi:hypothetical protein